ncbi:hypothetical protein [Rhizobium herbae]|uniref:Uncharacterized protein n=1 Tax=Rhizobium herbae TaxID=508661 RepID=A0ABS4EPA6_9HYPH|nr:hypothetical protein [Rhizobium herbae]MBP1859781.1 hypothetical protein [Rhizobium herbae]
MDVKAPKGSRDYRSSVAWLTKLPSTEAVHNYGCNSAAISNRKKIEAGKSVTPTKDAAHYIGFYKFSVGSALKHENAAYQVFVEYWPEEGQDEHCNLVLVEKPDLPKKVQELKSFHRTNIIEGIWAAMEGPDRYVCACDIDHSKFLSDLYLPPAGTQEAA